MAHFPSSRLSRQELYSYGFKEGQPWGEDRRTLESALHAMDQLEGDIQQNYIYGRPAPTNNIYAPTPAAIPRRASAVPAGYFSPERYLSPDIRMARSDASDVSTELSSYSSYSGREYAHPNDYQDPMNYSSTHSGWRQTSPSIYQRSPSDSVSSNFQSFPSQYFVASPSLPPPPPPPPSRISPSSSSRNFHSVEDLQRYTQEAPYYVSRASNTSRSSNAVNMPGQTLSPSQMQLVAYNDGRPPSDIDASDDEHFTAPTSPQWSMNTNPGIAFSERSISEASSQGIYSEGSDVTRSSGYVESYDVASYGDYRSDSHHDSEDERDYMSDDIASNEGEYYSSGDEPDYEGEGDDVYSDGGYESDSYYDGSYSSE